MGYLRKQAVFLWGRVKDGRLQDMGRQIAFIARYARHYWKEMLLTTLLGLTGTVLGFVSSLVSRDLVDIITRHQTGELLVTFAQMAGAAIFSLVVGQLAGYYSTKISLRVDAEVKSDLFERFMSADWERVAQYHTVDLLQRWNADASQVAGAALNYVPQLITTVFRLVGSFAIVIANDWTFAVVALAGIPFSLLVSRYNIRRMRDRNKRSQELGAKVSGFDQEAFSNMQTIKAFGLVSRYKERLGELQQERIDMSLAFSRENNIMQIVSGLVGLVVSYASYGWGIYRVWSGAISYGTMTLFLSMAGQLTGSVSGLGGMVTQLVTVTTAAGRIMEICDLPTEDEKDLPVVRAFAERHESEGLGLAVRNVSFAYGRGDRVLHDVSLEVHPGEIIGIVGPSGYGKTTLLRLLLALVRPAEGEVALTGGAEELPVTPAVRQCITYVPQGNTLFSGTVAENLRTVAPAATSAEMEAALRAACAWDFVERLPDGIDSTVGERGHGFSEGQAQRIAIARALMRDAPLMLLDEASSALDITTERQVLRNMMGENGMRAVVVTTHRPTVLTLCDRVYLISEGACRVLNRAEVERLIMDF